MASQPRNHVLRALSRSDRSRLLGRCKLITLPLGKVLQEAASSFEAVYFPEYGVISNVAMFRDGSTIELATVGREGCTGVLPMLGGSKALATHIVQLEGEALMLSIGDYGQLLQSMKSLKVAVAAYARSFLQQVLVSGACNGIHPVDQRLARWLLLMRDRGDSDTMPLSQDFLALMLGVRRPSVTTAARRLRASGAISYSRGRLTITDRAGLERASCECYGLIRDGYREP